MYWNAQWVRDALVTGMDLVVTAGLITGAVLLHHRWLAAVGGVWAVLALRQGQLITRARRRSMRTLNSPSSTRDRPHL
ncbi:hypothetical protein ABZ826_38410 [Streptomyces sp. NPDC047515]|uniref:hypothetical protein n=1 Tax=Streptomyces sp. NPDC047515 TaxID=3155380 RepID=UPI00340D8E10